MKRQKSTDGRFISVSREVEGVIYIVFSGITRGQKRTNHSVSASDYTVTYAVMKTVTNLRVPYKK